jgi:hypothetical protein
VTYIPNTLSSVVITTAGSLSPNLITAAQSGTIFSNEGAIAENYNTLPSASKNLRYGFACKEVVGMRITANTGDVIHLSTGVTAVAGFIKSVVEGSIINLIAINDSQWFGQIISGTWTVDA